MPLSKEQHRQTLQSALKSMRETARGLEENLDCVKRMIEMVAKNLAALEAEEEESV